MITSYVHQVQYYETDKMGITNNTNYVRFMEEARNNYLSQIGFPYAKLETKGIISPVTKVSCKYLRTTTYPDQIAINVYISKVTHFKLCVKYVMKVNGKLVCIAYSEHCFLDSSRKIMNIKNRLPHLYRKLVEEQENKEK